MNDWKITAFEGWKTGMIVQAESSKGGFVSLSPEDLDIETEHGSVFVPVEVVRKMLIELDRILAS